MINKKGELNFRNLFTRWYFILIIVFLVAVLIFTGIFKFHVQDYILRGGFDVGSKTFIKLNVPEGGETSETITINNNGRGDYFTISFSNLDNIVSIKENKFYIKSGESKQAIIKFIGNSSSKINMGLVIIKSSSSIKKIPVVFGIEDKSPIFAITQIPIPNYINVFLNGKVGVDVKFSNLRDNDIHNVQTTYIIKDFEGNIYFSETEYLTVKDSLSVAKIIDLPENVKKGNYVFISTLMSDGSTSFSSYIFEVRGKDFNINFDILQNYLVIFILIAVVVALFYFIYIIRGRSEMYHLSRQQKKEMKKNLELIKRYREEVKKNLKAELIEEERKILEERLKLKKEREARELSDLKEKLEEEQKRHSIFWKSIKYAGDGIKSYLEKRKREKLREKREEEQERARKRREELNIIHEKEKEEKSERLKKLREQREEEKEEERERRRPSIFKKLFRKFKETIKNYKEKQRRAKLRKIREAEREEKNRRTRELREQREEKIQGAKRLSAVKRFFRKISDGLSNLFKRAGRKTEKIVKEAAKEQEKLREKKEKLTKEGQEEVASEFKKKKNKLVELFEEKLKQIDKKKEEIVKELKEKHEEQKEEIKELNKEDKKDEIKERLILWEKEAEEMPIAKKQLNIKESKIKQILKKEEKQTEQEFMKKFYSDLRKKRFKLE